MQIWENNVQKLIKSSAEWLHTAFIKCSFYSMPVFFRFVMPCPHYILWDKTSAVPYCRSESAWKKLSIKKFIPAITFIDKTFQDQLCKFSAFHLSHLWFFLFLLFSLSPSTLILIPSALLFWRSTDVRESGREDCIFSIQVYLLIHT